MFGLNLFQLIFGLSFWIFLTIDLLNNTHIDIYMKVLKHINSVHNSNINIPFVLFCNCLHCSCYIVFFLQKKMPAIKTSVPFSTFVHLLLLGAFYFFTIPLYCHNPLSFSLMNLTFRLLLPIAPNIDLFLGFLSFLSSSKRWETKYFSINLKWLLNLFLCYCFPIFLIFSIEKFIYKVGLVLFVGRSVGWLDGYFVYRCQKGFVGKTLPDVLFLAKVL